MPTEATGYTTLRSAGNVGAEVLTDAGAKVCVTYYYVPCDDGIFCNGVETCDESTDSCASGTPVNCNNGVYCDGVETCDESTDNCAPGTAVNCDNGVYCDGVETCDETTDNCAPGTPVDCDNGVYCDGEETCDETTDSCAPGTPVDCDDGDACNGLETCDESTDSCAPGTPVNCDDGDECTADSCDPATGDCEYTPICEDCETAWAKPNNDGTKCFPGTGNWGWYVKIPAGTIASGGVFETSGDVWAGAAKCDLSKGTDVGEASISLTANNIDVEFALADDCHVTDLHVWASNDKPAGPGFNNWYKSVDITFNKALNLNKDIYVAVHTETCCLACNDEDLCTY